MKIMKFYFFSFVFLLHIQMYGQYEEILCHPCVLNAHNQDPNQFIYFSNDCPNEVMITWGVFGDLTTIYLNELDCEGFNNPLCDPQNSIVIFNPNNDIYPNCNTNHTNFQTYFGSLSQATSVSSCQDYPKKEVFNLGDEVRLYSHIILNQDSLNFDLLMRATYPNGSIKEFYSYDGTQPNGNPIPSPIQGGPNDCNYLYWNITPDAAGIYYVDYILIYQDDTQYQYGNSTFTIKNPGPPIPTFTDVTPPSFNNITAYDAQIGDIDNDGTMDIIFHKLHARNNSTANTTSFEISPYPSGSEHGNGSLLDIDNDSLLDYIQSYADLVDFNNDGIMSLLTGSEYVNCGLQFAPPACILTDITDNSCIIENPNSYQSAINTDFNNDRVYDLALGNNIYTNIQSGFDQLRTLPFTVETSKAFDVNNDGKADIVYGNNESPLQIMLNNGNISTVGEHKWPQIHVGDINNDGYLDILHNGVYFKNGDQMAFTFINNFAGLSPDANLFKPIDYDNDGDLDLLLLRFGLPPKLFRNDSTVKNTLPSPPSNTASTVTANEATFSWNPGGDDRTAYPTYNLYVYNKDTNTPVLLPSADLNSGVQRKLQKGNTEYNDGWKLKNLSAGRYGWKVQAVDQGFLGSLWSAEKEFVIEPPLCETEVEIIQNTPTCKAVKVVSTGEILKICGIANGLPTLPPVGFSAKIAYNMENGCPIDPFCYAAYSKINIVCFEPSADVQFILPFKNVNYLDTFSIPILVTGFQNIGSFQFPVTYDTSKLEFVKINSFNNNTPNILSNLTNKGKLRFLFSLEDFDNPVSVSNYDTLVILDFKSLSSICDSTMVCISKPIPIPNEAAFEVQVTNINDITLNSLLTDSKIKINQALCNDCAHPDYAPLMALYNSTNGPGWMNNKGWQAGAAGESCDPCNFNGVPWYGIRCENGRVTHINLTYNQLNGPIPKELGNLANLNILGLGINQLIGVIPKELGKLINLDTLTLGDNQLNGLIPKELGNLYNLKILALSQNQLNGAIPKELGNLINLEELLLGRNQISGSIPKEFGNLTQLQKLFLDVNQLKGPIPMELSNLLNLRTLSLHNNQLNGPIPKELGSLLSLKYLFFHTNQFNGPLPKELGNLINLEELLLSENQLSGFIPEELGSLPKLNLFMLNNNNFSGCFAENLLNVCDIGFTSSIFKGYNLLNNPLLPWQGDFTRFCNGESQTGAPCNDGNPNNVNDKIQDDCTCRGEIVCPDAKITFPSDTINLCLTSSLSPIPLPFSITGNFPGELPTVLWSGTNNGINNAISPATINPQLAGPGTHRLILTYQQRSCVWTDTMYVVLKPTPSASFTCADKLCISNPLNVTYTGTNTLGRTLIWDSSGVVRTDISSTAFSFTWATPGIKTLSLSVDLNGCASTPFSRIIEVEAVPAPPVPSCEQSLGEVRFSWTAIPCASMYEVFINGMSRGVQSQRSIVVTGLAVGESVTCRVQAISTCACPIAAVQETCTSKVCPPVTISLTPAADSICLSPNATSINLSAIITGNSTSGSGSWTGPGTDQNGVFIPQTADVGVHNITYSYTDSGCIFSKTATITVFPFKKAGTGTGVEFLQGSSETVNLFALLSGEDTGGIWSSEIPALSGFSSASGIFNLTNGKPGTYVFTYLQTSPANICNDSARVSIVIVPIDPCDFAVYDDFLTAKPGNDHKLNLLDNDDIIQHSFLFSILSYDKKYINRLVSGDSGDVELRVEAAFYDTLLVVYEVCTADCTECKKATLKITNETLKDIILTNIILPNTSGKNSTLRFSEEDILEESELYIFNRNGDRIFHMKDYDNSWNADGYPGGIYYYVLRYRGVDIKKTLTVMK